MVHHGEFLRAASRDDHLVYHLEHDWKEGPIDDQERAMLTFVEKLNNQPGKIAAEDVEALRKAGFEETGVLDIIMITALFNFMNRVLDGVGIRAEDSFRQNMERGHARVEAAAEGGEAAGR